MANRIWLYDNKSKRAWNALKQTMTTDMDVGEYIGHELWAPNGKGMYYIKYATSPILPCGVGYLDLETGEGRILYSQFKYWHCCPSQDERFIAGDTQALPNKNDCNVIVIDRRDNSEVLIDTVKETGTHPSHPHPQFSLDNSKLCYTFLKDNGNLAVKIAYLKDSE